MVQIFQLVYAIVFVCFFNNDNVDLARTWFVSPTVFILCYESKRKAD